MQDTEKSPPAAPSATRDAFHLALVIGALFLAFLTVLGIAAWNTRIAFLPLTPKAMPAAPTATSPAGAVLRILRFGVVIGQAVEPSQQVGRPAPLGVAAPGHAPAAFAGFQFCSSGGNRVSVAESDTGVPHFAQSCPASTLRNSSINENAERPLRVPESRSAMVKYEHAARDGREHGCNVESWPSGFESRVFPPFLNSTFVCSAR